MCEVFATHSAPMRDVSCAYRMIDEGLIGGCNQETIQGMGQVTDYWLLSPAMGNCKPSPPSPFSP
jgi:hypothetical protein